MEKFLVVCIILVSLLVASNHVEKETECFNTQCIEDNETRETMQRWEKSTFGLQPHHPNYLLPFGISSGEYEEYVVSDSYKNVEAELQISLKWNLQNNLFGLNEKYNLAYTHTAFWQIYSSSSPFRETNYNPEFFIKFPIEDDSVMHLKYLTVGLAHLSNGQGNIEETDIPDKIVKEADAQPYLRNRSRSINYMYLDVGTQHQNFLIKGRVWVPYFGENLSDNPDIMDYLGFTSLGIKYFYGKNLLTFDTRLNLVTLKGAAIATYSYPVYDGLFFFTKFFTGYGESLIDYNNYITKFSVGFSFSR